MTELPDDSTLTTAAPPPAGNLADAPRTSAQQREDDFNRVFSWHGREISFSIASELYYRALRAHLNMPPLGSYQTLADFSAEAPLVLYCAHFRAADLRALRLLAPEDQVAAFDAWVESNIGIHELNAATQLAQEINAAIARARTTPHDTGDKVDGLGNSPSRP